MKNTKRLALMLGIIVPSAIAAGLPSVDAQPPSNPDPPGYEVLNLMFGETMGVKDDSSTFYSTQNQWFDLEAIFPHASQVKVFYAGGPNGEYIKNFPGSPDQIVAFLKPNHGGPPRTHVERVPFAYDKIRIFYLPASRDNLPGKMRFRIYNPAVDQNKIDVSDIGKFENSGDEKEEGFTFMQWTDRFFLTPEGGAERSFRLPTVAPTGEINARKSVNFIIFPSATNGAYQVFLHYYIDDHQPSRLVELVPLQG